MTEKYQPSNGTMGMIFMADFCDRCAVRGICRILPKTMIYRVDDPEYPEQWTYDEEGNPTCTSFTDGSRPRHFKPCNRTRDMFDPS